MFYLQNGKGCCEKNSIGYEIICETCMLAGNKAKYLGESGRNGYTRGAEHQAALRMENEENALWKHCVLEHNSMWADFSMRVCCVFHSCLVRQVNKAVRIETCQADIVMNSKAEFHQAPLVRVMTTNEEQEDRVVVRQGRGGAARGGAVMGGAVGGARQRAWWWEGR